MYDWTVLNPINFIMISLLEFGLTKYPESKTMRVWLIKMYAKLGLAKNVNELSDQLSPNLNEKDYEKLGAIRFSMYSDYGMQANQEECVK